MKKICIIISMIGLIGINNSKAQNNEVKLEDLKLPSSPAFILLDVAPTSIDRPTTTKAFSTSILNSINENNGIPENYALDFAPYWFFKHKKLNAMNYWGFSKTKDGNFQKPFSQARYGNLSFATVKTEIPDDTLGTMKEISNIALGFRTTLLQWRSDKDIEDLISYNNKHVERLSQLTSDPNISPIDLIRRLESDKILSDCNKNIANVLNRKPVIALDLAGAGSWSFEDNTYSTVMSNRAGAWLTLNYAQSINKKDNRNKNDYINIYLTCRLLNDNNVLSGEGSLTSSTIFDSGGKIELELDKFSISYEYLYRNDLNTNYNSYRSSGLIKYRASEQLLVTAAFGKNFGDLNNAITQIGISWCINNNNQRISVDKIE